MLTANIHKSLEGLRDKKKPKRVSWSEREDLCIITGRCIWKLSQQVHWDISTWSALLFIGTRIGIGDVLKKTKMELVLLIDIDICC